MDNNKLFIVAISALVMNKKRDKFLVLKRAMHEIAYPGKWSFPGGKMEHGQSVSDTLEREVLEEAGIIIKKEKRFIVDFSFLRPDGFYVAGMTFEVFAESEDVVISEDFDSFMWVTPEEFFTMDHIEGLDKTVRNAFKKPI